jgi:hypothetical protein
MRRVFYVFLTNCFIGRMLTGRSSNNRHVIEETTGRSPEDPVSAYE